MDQIDHGLVYIDVMTWLLSSKPDSVDVEDNRRMFGQLKELLIHLTPGLLDRFLMTIIHSPNLWSISLDHLPARATTTTNQTVPARDHEGDLHPGDQSIEPFRTIFLNLKLASLTRFKRSSLTGSNPSNLNAFNDSPDRILKLKPLTIKFIEHWNDLVGAPQDNLEQDHSVDLHLRQLCLIVVLFTSTRSFDLSSSSSFLACSSRSRLQSSIELNSFRLLKSSIIQQQPSSQSPHTFDRKSVITWLAVQIVPSIDSNHLARSSTSIVVDCLADSFFKIFQDGNMFRDLATSLDLTNSSLHLNPSSITHRTLKKASDHPLAQVVLTISLSISRLIENTTLLSDLESFQIHLITLVQVTERIHQSWREATHTYDRVTLPTFRQDGFSVDQSKPVDDLADRWLKSTFFCCILILGGLVNRLSTFDCPQELWPVVLNPGFKILCQIHFIALRFPPDQLSTHTAVLNTFVSLSKPHKRLCNLILQECQPTLIKSESNIFNPMDMSRVIYYFNLIERLSGSMIEKNYLDQIVVPLILSYLEKTEVRFHALTALLSVWEFCSQETVLNLADKYFQILIQDISLDQASALTFEQQKIGWKNLLKSVSKYSKPKTEELTTRLIKLIKDIDPLVLRNDKGLILDNLNDHQAQHQTIERRKKFYKLLISQIGELNYEPSIKEIEGFLDSCWDLIQFEDDLIELFEVGLNHQSFKIPNSQQFSNLGVHWWLQKKIDLNHSLPSKL